MHLGLRIKLARVAKGLTQQQLADKINKTRPLISHIEQTGMVNHYTLTSICNALDVNLEDFDSSARLATEPAESQEVLLLRNENQQLKQEILALKEVINSQKELIELLKEKRK